MAWQVAPSGYPVLSESSRCWMPPLQMFSINGYHDTSMDAIAAKAEISKPMLYLYYGSKEELFGACLDRELARFIDGVRADIDLDQSPRDLLHNTIVSFMRYIDANRASWIVMYAQATNSQAFAHTVREGRERIIALVVRVLQAGTRNPEPDSRLRDDRGRAGGRR